MRIVQITLDDELVKQIDRLSKKRKLTRSAFMHEALTKAVAHYTELGAEKKHRQGYVAHPVNKDEFSVWENEQDWGDD